jgi:hypothetical protein
VVLTITVTNLSAEKQWYNLIRVVGSFLRFNIRSPDGEQVGMYGLPAGIAGSLEPLSDETAIQPGQSRTGRILISDYYPVTASEGTYTIEVLIRPYPNIGEASATLLLDVSRPGDEGQVEEVLDPFARSLATIRGTAGIDNTALEALEQIIHTGDASLAYLKETAEYYLARLDFRLSKQDQWIIPAERRIDVKTRQPAELAVLEFESFVRRYPNSIFADVAQEGLSNARYRLRRQENSNRH